MSLTRARIQPLQIVLIAVLAIAVLYAPSLVALSVTTDDEPVRFIEKPWTGWQFAGTVLVASVQADAPSPGSALQIAHDHWQVDGAQEGSDTPDPVEVGLLYIPSGTRVEFSALTPSGEQTVRPKVPDSLVWQVRGRYDDAGAVGPIGLIDFSTGKVLWDVRDLDSKEAA